MVRPNLGVVYLLYATAFLATSPTAEGVLQDSGRTLAADGMAHGRTDGRNAMGGQHVSALHGGNIVGNRGPVACDRSLA